MAVRYAINIVTASRSFMPPIRLFRLGAHGPWLFDMQTDADEAMMSQPSTGCGGTSEEYFGRAQCRNGRQSARLEIGRIAKTVLGLIVQHTQHKPALPRALR